MGNVPPFKAISPTKFCPYHQSPTEFSVCMMPDVLIFESVTGVIVTGVLKDARKQGLCLITFLKNAIQNKSKLTCNVDYKVGREK